MTPETQAALDTVRLALSGEGAMARYYKQRSNWEKFHAEHQAERDALDVLARELERLHELHLSRTRTTHRDLSDLIAERDAERARADRLLDGIREALRELDVGGSSDRASDILERLVAEHGSPEEARP